MQSDEQGIREMANSWLEASKRGDVATPHLLLSPRNRSRVGGAFAGTINLHDFEAEIDALAATYGELRSAIPKT